MSFNFVLVCFNESVLFKCCLYSHSVSFLFISNSRPDIYTLYIEEPDSSGHSFGPVSAGVSSFYIFLILNCTKNGVVLGT